MSKDRARFQTQTEALLLTLLLGPGPTLQCRPKPGGGTLVTSRKMPSTCEILGAPSRVPGHRDDQPILQMGQIRSEKAKSLFFLSFFTHIF